MLLNSSILFYIINTLNLSLFLILFSNFLLVNYIYKFFENVLRELASYYYLRKNKINLREKLKIIKVIYYICRFIFI